MWEHSSTCSISDLRLFHKWCRFLVDKYSDLYYDPTLLFEAVKKVAEDEGAEDLPPPPQIQPPPSIPQSSQHTFQIQQTASNTSTRSHHTPRRDLSGDIGMPPAHMREQSPHHHRPGSFPGSPAGINQMGMNMGMGMRGPPGGGGPYPGAGGGGPPFNPSGNQFMQSGDLASGGSPMRMGGGMANMGMGMGGGMRPNLAGMGGMGGMPGNMGGVGMGGIPMVGGMGGTGMAGPGLGGGGMGGIGGGGMMNMGGMGGNMTGNMAGMGVGMGGGMPGMGMGMGNMAVDMGLGMNMSPRGMRGVPDDGGFSIH